MEKPITISGGEELSRKLKILGPLAAKVSAQSLYQSAEEVMAESKEQYVPVDVGALRSTGKVLRKKEGNDEIIILSYGGPVKGSYRNKRGELVENVHYAVHVHEDLQAHHPVGEAKYLEKPLMEAIPQIQKNLAADIEDAISSL